MTQKQHNRLLTPLSVDHSTEFVSVDHAADLLDVHPSTIRRWVSQGILRGVRIGKTTIRVDFSSLKIEAIVGAAA